MVDRSGEFAALVGGARPGPFASPSPFVLKCASVLCEVQSRESYLANVYEEFVGYHDQVLGANWPSSLGDRRRAEIGQEASLFVATALSDVQELQRIARYCSAGEPARQRHYEGVLANLTKRLERFAKNNKRMQRERERICSRSPFRLFSAPSSSSSSSSWSSSSSSSSHIPASHHQQGGQSRAERQKEREKQEDEEEEEEARKRFAERYEGEVAKPAVLRQFDDIAARQKASLLKEASHLSQVFSQELALVTSAESTVESVAAMLGDFVALLSEQAEQVEEIAESGKATTEAVQHTAGQLQKTIDRTESHGRNMAFLAIGLALLLLLLDWITP